MAEDIVENFDRAPASSANTLSTYAGTSRGRVSVTAAALATVAEASAVRSVAPAAARALSTGAVAHAGLGGVFAQLRAQAAWAEAHFAGVGVGVGLRADTGVSDHCRSASAGCRRRSSASGPASVPKGCSCPLLSSP